VQAKLAAQARAGRRPAVVQQVIPIGLDDQGKRNKGIELMLAAVGILDPASESLFTPATR
jgi:hypothetical protein